ncbi:MAG: hypothetical protein A3J24_09400 [Deltaproteobacteria bacterium RIFCSPLOWO2_02_FULL_53_8]|nr:MAG: hypothetical protein A3J24_09400 [Deltaproteobacteria bacterium RIFCSPLOWO2_02_FULL_53_8]
MTYPENHQQFQSAEGAVTVEAVTFPREDALAEAETKRRVPDPYKLHLEQSLKFQRLPHHSKNVDREKVALAVMGNSHLFAETLVNSGVRSRHAKNLNKRVRRLLSKSLNIKKSDRKKYEKFGTPAQGYFESSEHQKSRELISFITVIHAVAPLDVDVALKKAEELKQQVAEYVRKVPGAACIGAIEVEICSIKQAQRIREYNSAQMRKKCSTFDEDGVLVMNGGAHEKRFKKLAVLEALSPDLDDSEISGESGQCLIHFHGLLKVENSKDTQTLREAFLTNPNWSRKAGQVRFSPLSETWNGTHKAVEESVKHITAYATKGGNRYLQYKLEFPELIQMSFDEYLKLSDQFNSNERQAKIEKGELLDLPILSHHEINSLVLVIDGMMNWNKTRSGYIISVGKW